MASSATGKSGTTLEGYFKYISRHKPSLVLWENSDKTRPKDLEHLMNQLWLAGYLSMWDKVDAKDFSPQSETEKGHDPAVILRFQICDQVSCGYGAIRIRAGRSPTAITRTILILPGTNKVPLPHLPRGRVVQAGDHGAPHDGL